MLHIIFFHQKQSGMWLIFIIVYERNHVVGSWKLWFKKVTKRNRKSVLPSVSGTTRQHQDAHHPAKSKAPKPHAHTERKLNLSFKKN